MAESIKPSTLKTNRSYVMADSLPPKTWHEIAKTEGTFAKQTPAQRMDGRDHGMTADQELQKSIKAAIRVYE